ncbi:hypothetical protein [Streptomyces sp. XH2]|uniref:hypothetical protein n=1 Tax=Streptomyces sp. XH2 TaxID=3412483 RepID=UPI003C7990E6
MSARHARDDAIDTTHPARSCLALAAIALGVPVAVILNSHCGALLDEAPAPVTMPDSASAD